MALILNIETATEVCSVALAQHGKLIAVKEDKEGQQHAKWLTVFIDELFKNSDFNLNQLDAVAVSMGPGSYTGLRIGVSVAKGIAYAGNLPLIAINTLQSMSYGVSKNEGFNPDTWFCPMIDARRMEVYTSFFDLSNQTKKEISAEIITENSFSEILAQRQIIFFGNGAAKCSETIKSPNAVFLNNITCSASQMVELSFKAFNQKQFVDVAYFEPFYLKDFVATIPKNTILNK